ncbi:MAG: 3'-5' exonuclease [Spirochaetales bacterium]|nr:3'-5' exonuclease [Spirochaetales bacterium]
MSEGFFDFYEQRNEEKPLNQALFASLDLETTGLYPDVDSILEVGIILFQNWSTVDTFHSLVDPERTIPEAVVTIHGIDERAVIGKPTISELFPAMKKFLGDAVLVAHNAPFDISFLSAAADKNGFTFHPAGVIDTRILAKKALPGLPSYSLQNLAAHLGIQVEEAHRAVDDARVCMELFEIICEKIGGKELLTADIIEMSIR